MASSLAALLFLLQFSSAISISSNSISRSTEQQIIATVTPVVADADASQSVQPFLTSPSGKYAAYLRRAADDSPGGPGGDVCYVEILQADDAKSVWQSDCTPLGGADTCDLAFSPVGLELFAGGHSLWDTAVDADPGTLRLDDAGDMSIVSKDGVTVWKESGEAWTGQKCGAATPVSSSPSTDVLPPPAATSAKLLTPPAATFAGPWDSGFNFGDQTAAPIDTSPDETLPPPPADASTGSPDLLPPPTDASTGSPDWLPPPTDDASTGSPDLPLSPPPPADTYPIPETPDQPLYSSPPPAPTAFDPQTPPSPIDTTPPAPSAGSGETSPDTPLPDIATPPGSQGGMAFPPPPVGMPQPHGPLNHPPMGASPAVPIALAPGAGHGAGAGLPFGQGQGQGVFGQQQNQILHGAGQPLVDSSAGWSGTTGSKHGRAAIRLALVGLMALAFGF